MRPYIVKVHTIVEKIGGVNAPLAHHLVAKYLLIVKHSVISIEVFVNKTILTFLSFQK